ncbi:MAG: hypothetical protein EXS08_08670 [Planctomycetes bacterium]|nr:hypothetical protein [Planctomycetota bacterium]
MRTTQRPKHAREGFSLVDVCVALFILAIALGTLVGSIFYALRLEDVNAESAAASQQARAILEELNSMDFAEIFAAYNEVPGDDPDPTHDYVAALQTRERVLQVGGKGGPTVSVVFPSDGLGHLREDVDNPAMGMPRDLNGDEAKDANDHSGDYVILPVTLRLAWEGVGGDRTLEMSTLLRAR